MELINMTGHPIKLVSEDGREHEIAPSGIELRVIVRSTRNIGNWNGVPIVKCEFGDLAIPVDLLPGWDRGALYIVSAVVARAVREHHPEHCDRFLVPGRTIRGTGIVIARALITA